QRRPGDRQCSLQRGLRSRARRRLEWAGAASPWAALGDRRRLVRLGRPDLAAAAWGRSLLCQRRPRRSLDRSRRPPRGAGGGQRRRGVSPALHAARARRAPVDAADCSRRHSVLARRAAPGVRRRGVGQMKTVLRWLLTAWLLGIGSLHFLATDEFV